MVDSTVAGTEITLKQGLATDDNRSATYTNNYSSNTTAPVKMN